MKFHNNNRLQYKIIPDAMAEAITFNGPGPASDVACVSERKLMSIADECVSAAETDEV